MNYIKRTLLILALTTGTNTAGAEDGRFNIKTAPVSALIGITNVELDISVSDHFTAGPLYAGFNLEHSDVDYDADALGFRINYYFGKALSGGWLVSLSGLYGDFKISEENNGITYSTTTATRAYTALFSYQAMWKHFNMTFGVGASYFSLPNTVAAVEGVDVLNIDTSFLSGTTPNAEFTIGWRF